MRRRVTGIVSAFPTDWVALDVPARLPDLNVQIDTGTGIVLGTRNWYRITEFWCGPADGDPFDPGQARYLLRNAAGTLLYDWTQTDLNTWRSWPVNATPLFLTLTTFPLGGGQQAELAEVFLADGTVPEGEQQ